MEENISFFMPMEIVPTTTHQMKAVRVVNGKPVFYEPPAVKDARAMLTAHLNAHRPEEPMQGAIGLVVKWCFPCDERHKPRTWRTTRPDTDNLNKLLKDCMTALGFWQDDAQVAQEIIEKFWADVPGIYIRVEQLEDTQ